MSSLIKDFTMRLVNCGVFRVAANGRRWRKHTVKEWTDGFKSIGKKEGYNDAEIEEYGIYIEMIARSHNSLPQP